MTEADNRERFRRLPDAVRLEDAVETVDVSDVRPLSDEHEERARMLRDAGAPGLTPLSEGGGSCPATGP